MTASYTQLDPHLPVCWEDSDTIRVGFEKALARVHEPSAGKQRLIYQLTQGVCRTRIGSTASKLGATADEVSDVLAALAPALRDVEAPPDHEEAKEPKSPYPAMPVRTLLCDDGRPLPGFRDALNVSGVCGFDVPHGREPALVILVERFLEPLHRAQSWLMKGIPHLLIRLTDRAIHVGPIVASWGAPCHTCISLALVREDPALPSLAAQLCGTRPCSETASGVHFAAAVAATFIRTWRANIEAQMKRDEAVAAGRVAASEPTAAHPSSDFDGVHTLRVTIPMTGGVVAGLPTKSEVAVHPECGCSLPG